MKKLVSFDYAKKIMFKNISKNETEVVSLQDAEDRVLAENIYSRVDVPHFSNSAVDGFGFKYTKLKKKEYNIVGESKPGSPFLKKLKDGEAIKVYTGAYIIKEITIIDTVLYGRKL